MSHKNLAIKGNGFERWIVKHSQRGTTPILHSDGTPWTRQETETFIYDFLKDIDKVYSPRKSCYETKIIQDGGKRVKIRFFVKPSISDKSYGNYIGGEDFHGDFIPVK